MVKSNRNNCEKAIQKALKDLFTDIYSTIMAAVCACAISLFILAHRFKEHQNWALRHAAYQLLIFNEKNILKRWIQHQCCHEWPSTYDMLWNMINMILQSQATFWVLFVGSHWPQHFLNWHFKLRLKRLRTITQQQQLETT